jgi:uncharacterized paraquat-inducible protein A
MNLPKIVWENGICDECGSQMKVPVMRYDHNNECNQCKLLALFGRLEYLVENNLGWR